MEDIAFEIFVRETLNQILGRLGKIEDRLDKLESNVTAGFAGINKRLDDIESEFGSMKADIEKNTADITQIKERLNLS